ncbi:hypothetical protein [Pseudarthrobacter sp. NS4]|uniref:hypothetical protein n=1 Tax=Pseudarthrobacter sp. NS4 TaxID=2973976 RepID=UPI0021638AF0|nr:hypothetical protein [Pseudarthrobacter sp. NS4]
MRDLRHEARILLQRENVASIDLWITYWNHGGRCHPFEFDAFINELVPLAWSEMEALALALDELTLEAISKALVQLLKQPARAQCCQCPTSSKARYPVTTLQADACAGA